MCRIENFKENIVCEVELDRYGGALESFLNPVSSSCGGINIHLQGK